MALLVVACLLLVCIANAASSPDVALCVQQGMLLLDKQIQPSGSDLEWSFCKEFQSCSCCNVSHVLTIQKYITQGAKTLTPCQTALASAACRVCHPEVGTGIIETVCFSQCDKWYNACALDYFALSPITSKLTLCHTTELICSQLKYLANNGTKFCEYLDIRVSQSSDEDCWYHGRQVEDSLCTVLEKAPLVAFQDVKYIILLTTLFACFWFIPHFNR